MKKLLYIGSSLLIITCLLISIGCASKATTNNAYSSVGAPSAPGASSGRTVAVPTVTMTQVGMPKTINSGGSTTDSSGETNSPDIQNV